MNSPSVSKTISVTIMATQKPPFTVEEQWRNVHNINFKDIKPGWEQDVLLTSDRHHDNAHCDQKLEKRHLDEALKRNAVIIDAGDLFCVMQGKYDPRSSKSALRKEHAKDDYLDAVLDEAAKFYAPYSHLFAVIGMGNHETKIIDRCGVSLTKNLVRLLNHNNELSGTNHRAFAGGYGGWVRFQFTFRGTCRQGISLKYFHGFGGDSPVTRGMLHVNRQGIQVPDADIVLNGHNHHAYAVPVARERLSQSGRPVQDLQWYLRTPGYKNEFDDGNGNWHVERGGGARPLGAIWLKFYLSQGRIKLDVATAIEAG